jgi:hypothetical protein
MTRWSVGTLVVTLLVGPWGGCDRAPVTPPATPPAERAPTDVVDQPEPSGFGGVILLDANRRRG